MTWKNYRAVLWSVTLVLIGFSLFKTNWFPSLDPKDPFLIGQATASSVSIGQRLSGVYSVIGIGLISLLVLFFLFSRVLLPRFASHAFISWIDQLLFLLICNVIFGLFGIQTSETTILLGCSVVVLLIAGFIPVIVSRFPAPEVWISFGLVVCVNHLLFHSGILASLIGLILFLVALFRYQKTRLVQLVLSLGIALPAIVVLSIETAMILNQRHVAMPSVWLLFVPYFALFAWLFWRKEKRFPKLLYTRFLPFALVGLVLTQIYAPVIDQPEEVFEYANLLNPVMHWYDFGQLPLVHNISSHLLSDYFFEFIYTTLNGYDHTAAPTIYHNGIHLLSVLLTYYFLKQIFGNRLELVYLFLLVPFLFYVIPPYYSFALLPLIFIKKYFDNPTSKRIMVVGLSVLFTMLWRLDIGISLFIPVLIMLCLRYFFESGERRILLRGTISVILICGVAGAIILGMMYGHIRETLHYFGANQAHALVQITTSENFIFLLAYIVNPLIAVVLAFYLLVQLRSSDSKTFDYLLLILIGFYLFNLQRGLVRHSFFENREVNINSFIWLIYLLFIWRLVEHRVRLLPFMAAGFSMITLFTTIHSPADNRSVFESPVSLSLKDVPVLNKGRISRIHENPKFDSDYKAIISFLRTNTTKNQTFVDLTNTSMLYYYAHRQVPSYFNQYLQNTVDAFLQAENLKDLPHYDIPFAVVRRSPDDFFGGSDGIPHKVRYYRITAWIYQHYEPYRTIGTYTVWKKKGVKTSGTLTNHVVPPFEKWTLGAIPYYWKADGKVENLELVPGKLKRSKKANGYEFQLEKRVHPGEFLQITIHSGTDQFIRLLQQEFLLNFELKKGTHSYLLPVGCSEILVMSKEHNLQLESDQPMEVLDTRKMILKN